MRISRKTVLWGGLSVLGMLLILSQGIAAQDTKSKQPLTHDVYDSWRSIESPVISADAHWILYIETPQKGEAELVIVNVQDGERYRHAVGFTGEDTDAERAAAAAFTFDSRHVVFLISPTQEEVKKAKKPEAKEGTSAEPKLRGNRDKDSPKKKLGIMDLANGQVAEIESVQNFKLPKEAGGWVAYLKEKAPEPEEKAQKIPEKAEAGKSEEKAEEEKAKDKKKEKKYGTDLVLRNLNQGQEKVFASVLEYLFTKNGTFLYYTVSSKETPDSDGLYHIQPGQETGAAILSGEGNYTQLALDEKQTSLAFLSDRENYAADPPTFNLYGLKIGDTQAELWISHSSTPDFPKGLAVSDKSAVSFSEDGRVVLFGIKEIPEPEEPDKEDEEPIAEFELWHWNDPYPQPQQKVMAQRRRDNTWESVYHVDSQKFVQLADPDIPDVILADNGRVAFASTIEPYTKRESHFPSFFDVYVIDPVTGEKILVQKELYGRASLSPQAKFVFWFKGTDWYVYDITGRFTKNVTAGLGVRFDMEDWDTPSPARAYGAAGWTDNDVSLLVYDKYDIWEIKPDGSGARMITEGFGRKNHVTFRYSRLDREEKNISPDQQLLLSATQTETMTQGFYRDQVSGTKPPQKLIMADKSFGSPQKADKVDSILFTRSAFDEFPDLWISGLDFKDPHKLTDLSSQMDPFIWGKAELRDFLSADGKPLKGILIKPENFDPATQYPLMVYIYETLHQGLNQYRHPSPGSSVNPAFYVSNGYVLWMPDIEYDTGYPGKDALKCVLPGIHMLIREGYIDPQSIGIQGHSWGGTRSHTWSHRPTYLRPLTAAPRFPT